jgi:pimeloyl-ACP methyl ester carboxylesterase
MGLVLGGIKELLSFITVVVTLPLGVLNWDLSTPKTFPSYTEITDRPVLLVHGYLHNGAAWLYHRKALQKAGFRSIYTLNLGSPLHSIEEYSEVVRKKVMQIESETGRSDLILIGHSMGGLVCSYYATQIAAEGTVTHLITLGSPLDGTRTASLGFGECAHQMLYKSPFTERLQGEIINRPQIRWLHVASRADLIIWPQQSAIMYHDNAEVKIHLYLGHNHYLYSTEVSQDILDFLFTQDWGLA